MKLPCENCPFPILQQPCEPTTAKWDEWLMTDQGLTTSNYVGRCVSERSNAGITIDHRTGLPVFEYMLTRFKRLYTPEAQPRRGEVVVQADGQETVPLLAFFIDGDDFGDTNKKFNYETGNRVIWALAETLRKATRADDFIARWGGDEFAMGMAGLSTEQAIAKARRLRMDLRLGGLVEIQEGGVGFREVSREGLEEIAKDPEKRRDNMLGWSATIAGAYMENPKTMDDVRRVFEVANNVMSSWKAGDRSEEPALITVVPPSELWTPIS